MKEKYQTAAWSAAALVFLLALSVYRQLGRYNGCTDLTHPLVVYVGYLVLLGGWWISIQRRISQRNLRRYILAGIVVVVFWLTLRFLQEGVYLEDIHFQRISGYYIAVPLVLLPLFGLYAVLGLDKGPEYRLRGSWYLLLFPAAGLIGLMVSNEWHNMVFLPEPHWTLEYRPNWGMIPIVLWVALLVFFRLKLLREKSKENMDYPRLRYLPFGLGILMAGMYVPYMLASFAVEYEVIELTAKHVYVEAMIWESCIALGMVPVNTLYGQVFRESTVAMQIVDREGKCLIASRYAPEITKMEFRELRERKRLPLGRDKELCLHNIDRDYLIWQKDFSTINRLRLELEQTAEELAQEGTLLQRELATKSEESRIQAKSAIFDRLDSEVEEELAILEMLLEEESPEVRHWYKIGLIGTYVKRLCNLRLIYEESGGVSAADLEICVNNLMAWVKRLCPQAQTSLLPSQALTPEMCFISLKAPVILLESVDFEPQAFTVNIAEDLEIHLLCDGEYSIPAAKIVGLLPEGYVSEWKTIRGGLALVIRKEGEKDEEQK